MIFGIPIASIRKTLVAAAGILTTLLTANLLPASWAHWVSVAAGVLTVLATYQVKNAPTPGKHEAP